jgi:outer membrane protein OmpA-like peptidoglycan-associated protein
VDADGQPVSAAEAEAARRRAGGGSADEPEVWANYDFVPGERVLFIHDFEGTRTGNFPSRLDYIAGNLDVVELGSGDDVNKVLRVGEGTSEGGPGGSGCLTIPLPETLPERYTIEYRVRTSDPLHRATTYLFSDGSDDTPDPRCTYPPNPHVYVASNGSGLQLPGGYGAPTSGVDQVLPTNEWVDVAISVDGPYWKMYVDGERIANVPRFEFPRADKLHFFMNVYRHSVFLDDVRIAEGGPRSLYDDLEADGFIATTAIRFDTGKATIKPESTGILNEVLALLEDYDDLRLRIEGHTDDVGSDASNQTLSERRAEAVADWLARHGIDGDRLETAGRGESVPRVDSASDEGRAENRRVEFHRL